MNVAPFTAADVDDVRAFIAGIAAGDENLCVRPRQALMRAAAREGGVVARDAGIVCGFTGLYDTARSDTVECGSISVAPAQRGKHLAAYLAGMAVAAFYADPRNANATVIADVYEENSRARSMLAGLGFREFEAPAWIVNARGLKESPAQSMKRTICMRLNKTVLALPAYAALNPAELHHKAA